MRCGVLLLSCLAFVAVTADSSGVREMGKGFCRLQWSVTKRVLHNYGYGYRIIEEPHHIDFCCAGYFKVEHVNDFNSRDFRCDPVCEPQCQGSNCTAPGHCECSSGYTKVHSSRCVPQCTPKCVNATCVDANKCKCLDGYKAAEDSHLCQPDCPFSCINADCVAPNTCRCKNGYEQTSSTICSAVCSLECESGFCSAPDVCSCFAGFTVSDENWNVCVPYCSQGCTNALCTSPEVCSCMEGFEKSKDNDTQCDPVCSKGCMNAECIAPDECSCLDGFVNDTRRGDCVPFCSTDCGEHGDCVSPENCVCHAGYHGAPCEPRCPVGGCDNGECSRPGYCGCRDGSVKINTTYCLPLCPDEPYSCYQTSVYESTGDFLVTESSAIHLPEHITLQMDSCSSSNTNFTLLCFTEVDQNETIASVTCWPDELFFLPEYESHYNLTFDSISSINFTFVYSRNVSKPFDCRVCLLNSSESSLKLGQTTTLTVALCPENKHPANVQRPSSDLLTTISFTMLGLLMMTSFFTVLFVCRRKITSYKVQDFEERRRASQTSEGGQVALMDSFQTNDDCYEDHEGLD